MRTPIVVLALLALVACESSPAGSPPPGTTPGSSAPTTVPTTVSPTPPALPADTPPTRGPATPTCVDGWVTPRHDTAGFRRPLGIVRRTTGVEGPLVVVDMRYFTGPESPPAEDKGYLAVVERWYIKLYAEDDLSFQGRFLVEARRFGRGLVAAAPYDTRGFRSPDWRGFQYDAGDTEGRPVEGLPGTWSGVEYDFVEGGAGLEIPGLPDEVIGCLGGT
jgi:hypothetical protein